MPGVSTKWEPHHYRPLATLVGTLPAHQLQTLLPFRLWRGVQEDGEKMQQCWGEAKKKNVMFTLWPHLYIQVLGWEAWLTLASITSRMGETWLILMSTKSFMGKGLDGIWQVPWVSLMREWMTLTSTISHMGDTTGSVWRVRWATWVRDLTGYGEYHDPHGWDVTGFSKYHDPYM